MQEYEIAFKLKLFQYNVFCVDITYLNSKKIFTETTFNFFFLHKEFFILLKPNLHASSNHFSEYAAHRRHEKAYWSERTRIRT